MVQSTRKKVWEAEAAPDGDAPQAHSLTDAPQVGVVGAGN